MSLRPVSIKLASGLASVLLCFCVSEITSYIIGTAILSKKLPQLVYDPTLWNVPRDMYENYLEERNPILGWTSERWWDSGDLDANGSRLSPAFPVLGSECMSVYGDSFAWSAEVDSESAWPNQLARLLNCRVANYGVGGYGADQAYLRFLNNDLDKAPKVILAIFSGDIERHVNQNRFLLTGRRGALFGLKPRFILTANGEISLIPIPDFSYQEFISMLSDPKHYLPYENFLPDTDGGPVSLSFPYTLFFLRAASKQIQLSRQVSPQWHALYSPDHPSKALSLTEKIASAFSSDAAKQEKQPYVVLLPSAQDMKYFREFDSWSYGELLRRLAARGVPVLNVGEAFRDIVPQEQDCSLYSNADDCRGHFSEYGYELVARSVAEFLRNADAN
jgi:hypothetical protein